MNAIYRRLWRHLVMLSMLATLVVVGGAALWLAAEALGFNPPLPWVIAGVGAMMFWSVSNDRGGPRTSPQPLPPPVSRTLSRGEVEALLVLQREGVITAAELRSALSWLIPPRAVGRSNDQSGRGR